jgi:hypothetical protein
MQSRKACVQRQSSLVKNGGSASAFNGSYIVKVEKVVEKQILIINIKVIIYYAWGALVA